jgi:hypothetical protein
MPTFFTFQQGNESGSRLGADAAPLLGRFRAVPAGRVTKKASVGDLFSSVSGSLGYGYGSLWRTRSGGTTTDGDGEWDSDGEYTEGPGQLRRLARWIRDIWIEPQKGAVGRMLDRWWLRWFCVTFLPAVVVC